MLAQDAADVDALDMALDEPLPSELTPEQMRRLEMRRIADANQAAVAALGRPV